MSEEHLIRIADTESAGERLDKWLAGWTELSRSRLRGLIESGAVTSNGEPIIDPSAKVQKNFEYLVEVPPPVDDKPAPEDIPLAIVYEDDDLIVVNKPAGMTVHPAPGWSSGTLVNALLYHARGSLSGIGGVMRPGIVHRIDKDTSGLLVIAKNDKAHQHLSKQFANHSVERAYIAYVRGTPKPSQGRIESRLARSPHDRKKQSVVKGTFGDMESRETGRHAVTNYAVLATYGQQPKASLGTGQFAKVECRLETGRTHQIRVHMAHIGSPLLGDPVYGRQRAFNNSQNPGEVLLRDFMKGFRRQALHAQTLGFIHPKSGEFMSFTSELPEDLIALETAISALNE